MTTTTETQATSQVSSVRRPLSISQLQLWYRCGYAWHLRYGLGHSPRAGAGAWFGRIMHETIALMYRGMRMDAAHTEVWARTRCGVCRAGPAHDERREGLAREASRVRCAARASNGFPAARARARALGQEPEPG